MRLPSACIAEKSKAKIEKSDKDNPRQENEQRKWLTPLYQYERDESAE
jgi:hypothetical protein